MNMTLKEKNSFRLANDTWVVLASNAVSFKQFQKSSPKSCQISLWVASSLALSMSSYEPYKYKLRNMILSARFQSLAVQIINIFGKQLKNHTP